MLDWCVVYLHYMWTGLCGDWFWGNSNCCYLMVNRYARPVTLQYLLLLLSQFGEYFGFSIAAPDLNGDGWVCETVSLHHSTLVYSLLSYDDMVVGECSHVLWNCIPIIQSWTYTINSFWYHNNAVSAMAFVVYWFIVWSGVRVTLLQSVHFLHRLIHSNHALSNIESLVAHVPCKLLHQYSELWNVAQSALRAVWH